MPSKLNILNHVFGRLTVIEYLGINDNHYSMWLCKCECGKTKVITGRQLTSGGTKSCGCLQKEKISALLTKHGCGARNIKTPEYKAWRSMTNRCAPSKNGSLKYYADKGTKICERWQGENGFENFLIDMGPKPTLKHTLDRFPNIIGDYEPSNCRWATRKEQDRGKTTNHWLEYDGSKMIISDWARELGTTPIAILKKLKKKSFSEIVKYHKRKSC